MNNIFAPFCRQTNGPMGKAGHITRRRELYGSSSPAMLPFFRLGGLARSQISARIGARQSNRRGNLSCGVFPYIHLKDPKRVHCCTSGKQAENGYITRLLGKKCEQRHPEPPPPFVISRFWTPLLVTPGIWTPLPVVDFWLLDPPPVADYCLLDAPCWSFLASGCPLLVISGFWNSW